MLFDSFVSFSPLDVQMHELAMKLALQKSQNAELRSQFEGKLLDEFCTKSYQCMASLL